MGMMEQQFDDCTPRYFVARLNGLRNAQKRQSEFQMQMVREICFYSANQFKKVVQRKDIFKLSSDLTAEEIQNRELKNALKDVGFMSNWSTSEKWKPPHD